MTVQCTNCLKMVDAAADGRLPPWCPWCGAELRPGSKSLSPQGPAKPVEAPVPHVQAIVNGSPPKPALPLVPAEFHSPAELRATADAFVRGKRLDWVEPLVICQALNLPVSRPLPWWWTLILASALAGGAFLLDWASTAGSLFLGGAFLGGFLLVSWAWRTWEWRRVVLSVEGISCRSHFLGPQLWRLSWDQIARLVFDEISAGGRNWNVLRVVDRAGEERVIGVGHKVTRKQLAELVEAYGGFRGVRLEGT